MAYPEECFMCTENDLDFVVVLTVLDISVISSLFIVLLNFLISQLIFSLDVPSIFECDI